MVFMTTTVINMSFGVLKISKTVWMYRSLFDNILYRT